MENKDLFDWISFISGMLAIGEKLVKAISEKAKKIEKPCERPSDSEQ